MSMFGQNNQPYNANEAIINKSKLRKQIGISSKGGAGASASAKNLNDAIEYIKKSNISYLNIGKTNGKKIKIDRDKMHAY